MEQQLNILIVEDNPDIAANIGDFLTACGHLADFAHDGELAVQLASAHDYDMAILDIMLPRRDGYSVARFLRSIPGKYLPIIMLTAKDTLENKLEGFDAGADDYLIKPFSLDELHARIKAQAGRFRPETRDVMQWCDIQVERDKQVVTINNKALDIGPTGYILICMLLEVAPELASRGSLERAVWGDSPPDTDALRSHVYNLRKQLRVIGSKCEIRTVHSRGFRLTCGDD